MTSSFRRRSSRPSSTALMTRVLPTPPSPAMARSIWSSASRAGLPWCRIAWVRIILTTRNCFWLRGKVSRTSSVTVVPVGFGPSLEILSTMVGSATRRTRSGMGWRGSASLDVSKDRTWPGPSSSDETSESSGSAPEPSADNLRRHCSKVSGLIRWKSGDEPSRGSSGVGTVNSSRSEAVWESDSRRGYCQHPCGRRQPTYL